jgi:hypothetical protein
MSTRVLLEAVSPNPLRSTEADFPLPRKSLTLKNKLSENGPSAYGRICRRRDLFPQGNGLLRVLENRYNKGLGAKKIHFRRIPAWHLHIPNNFSLLYQRKGREMVFDLDMNLAVQ